MALDEAGPETAPVTMASCVAALGLLVRLKLADPLTPEVDAVTVYGPPATVLAVKTEEVARPLEFVVTRRTRWWSGYRPSTMRRSPTLLNVGAVNVTDAPDTGLPPESVTLATSGVAKERVHRG